MKRVIFSLAALTLAASAFAQAPLSVNGQTITAAQQKNFMSILDEQGIKDKDQQLAIARNTLITQAVVKQEAEKQKITSDSRVKLAIDESKNRITRNALVAKHLQANPVKEEEIKEAYQLAKKAYRPEQVNLNIALFKTEKEAKDAIKALKDLKSFAEIAKKSLDKGTAERGGELGWTPIQRISIPGMADAVLALDKNQVRPIPFKSDLGYFVIQLKDKKEVAFPEYDKVKPEMTQLATENKANKYIDSLIKKSKISEMKK